MRKKITAEGAVRMAAGGMILLSVALAYGVDQRWLWLTVFVALNLIQSAFTGICPAETIFRALGMGKGNGTDGGGCRCR